MLSDSQGLVTRLQLGNVKDTWVAPLDNIKGSFRIAYIPLHAADASICYYEAADHLDGIVVPVGVIKFHPQNVVNRFTESSERSIRPNKTWWSLQRLQDRGSKCGAGALQSTRGSKTKLVTQEIMGAVTGVPH